MKLKFLRILFISAGLLGVAAGSAQAGDEDLFKGLIPGVPLAERELDQFYGTGIPLTIDGELINVNGGIEMRGLRGSGEGIIVAPSSQAAWIGLPLRFTMAPPGIINKCPSPLGCAQRMALLVLPNGTRVTAVPSMCVIEYPTGP